MNSIRILLSCICFFFFISAAVAIHCHVCNSHHNPDCASTEKVETHDHFLQDCSKLPNGERYSYCRKIEQDIPEIPGPGGTEAHTRIIRQCGYYNASSMGCTKAGMVNGGKQEICSCNEDGCNGAGQPQMLLGPIACLLTIVALVSHKLF